MNQRTWVGFGMKLENDPGKRPKCEIHSKNFRIKIIKSLERIWWSNDETFLDS